MVGQPLYLVPEDGFGTEDSMPRKFVFDCPACDVESVVDADIRAEVLEEGCVMCRTSVDAGAFVPLSEADAGRDTTR